MFEFTRLHIMLLATTIAFPLGAWLGPKIRDWFLGVPAGVRAGMKAAEAGLLAKLKDEEAVLVADFHKAVGITPPVPEPPVVPTPVVVPPPSPVVTPLTEVPPVPPVTP